LTKPVKIGVIGAGHWARIAHLPAYQRSKEAEVVAICDTNLVEATKLAKVYDIPSTYGDFHSVIDRDDVDVVDICTSANSHYPIALEVIKKRKAIICEKPLAMSLEQARALSERARVEGLKTKMGFTFRYSPALRRMKELIGEGYIGRPFIFNGFEQNSQFIDQRTPFRWSPSETSEKIMPGSLEEYAPHLIDLALWLFGDMVEVVGTMRNFIPERNVRDLAKMVPINIEDCCVWLGRFQNGAEGVFQSSFVTVGAYPGVEVRVYGSKGAMIARLAEESGTIETLGVATPAQPEFQQLESLASDNSLPWYEIYFGELIRSFVNDLIEDRVAEGDFTEGTKVQEFQEAIYLSHLRRRWTALPLK
jgi:predicted dehydrogenase